MEDNDRPPLGFGEDEIDLSQPHEVRYWMRRLRASAEQLSRAVLVVGRDPKKVELYLRSPQGRGYLGPERR